MHTCDSYLHLVLPHELKETGGSRETGGEEWKKVFERIGMSALESYVLALIRQRVWLSRGCLCVGLRVWE
jgi:hypothetical protein